MQIKTENVGPDHESKLCDTRVVFKKSKFLKKVN